MAEPTIYLDNAATTKVDEKVAEVVYKSMTKDYGNPSSLHRMGLDAEKLIENTKKVIMDILAVKNGQILFTSGGTEANNIAVLGYSRRNFKKGKHIITTQIEHPSVLAAYKRLEEEGFVVDYLEVDDKGYIDVDYLDSIINGSTILISIMHVNNEIGTIQQIQKISSLIQRRKIKPIFHIDAVQSFCKIPLKLDSWRVDMASISAHKIHGPKGVGALYVRDGVLLESLMFGGGQQQSLRSGTENVPGIAGFGKAAQLVAECLNNENKNLYSLKKRLATGILHNIKGAKVLGPDILDGAPHILSICFEGIKAEVLLHTLESNGVFISTGSACSAKKDTTSHVLKAINVDRKCLDSTVRFSLSYKNTEQEIDRVIQSVKQSVDFLTSFTRR